MRAIVEAIGAFFGMPVSEGKSRYFRIAVVCTVLVVTALAGLAYVRWQ